MGPGTAIQPRNNSRRSRGSEASALGHVRRVPRSRRQEEEIIKDAILLNPIGLPRGKASFDPLVRAPSDSFVRAPSVRAPFDPFVRYPLPIKKSSTQTATSLPKPISRKMGYDAMKAGWGGMSSSAKWKYGGAFGVPAAMMAMGAIGAAYSSMDGRRGVINSAMTGAGFGAVAAGALHGAGLFAQSRGISNFQSINKFDGKFKKSVFRNQQTSMMKMGGGMKSLGGKGWGRVGKFAAAGAGIGAAAGLFGRVFGS